MHLLAAAVVTVCTLARDREITGWGLLLTVCVVIIGGTLKNK